MSVQPEVRVAVDVRCETGEGPLWHPVRQSLLWVDIFWRVLFESRPDGGALRAHGFDQRVSAIGWVDETSVVVAGERGLVRLDLDTGERNDLMAIEADNPTTRSNDGRIDPKGGFWISTMGEPMVDGVGSLYRVHEGTCKTLQTGLTCPNSTAFSPDGTRAYFANTFAQVIFKIPLDPETSLPLGEPEIFADLSDEGHRPDGSVVDVEGCLWNAQYQSGRVARYRPDGSFDRAIEFPVSQTSCPALGGPDLRTLYVTSIRFGLSEEQLAKEPLAGAVFAADVDVPGQAEHRCTP